jgi:hypothetical protein
VQSWDSLVPAWPGGRWSFHGFFLAELWMSYGCFMDVLWMCSW